MNKKILIISAAVIILIASLVGLWLMRGRKNDDSSTSASVVVTHTPVIIGVLLPLTGEEADVASQMKMALDIAVEEINRAGGVQGRDIILKYADSGCDENKAQSAMRELIDSVPSAIIGGVCRSESLVAARISQGAGIPFVSPAAPAKEYAQIGSMVFRFVPSEVQEGNAAAAAATISTGTRAAVLYCDNEDCRALADSFSGALSGQAIPLSVSAKLATSGDAIRAQVKALSAAKVNFLYLPAYATDTQTFLNILASSTHSLSVYLPRFEDGLPLSYASRTPVYIMELSRPEASVLMQKVVERVSSTQYLSQYALRSYDILKKLADVLTRSSLDNPKTAELLSKIENWQGIADRYTIDPETGDMKEVTIAPVLAPQK
jgi:branched-chain amino acid transport system substrate-binding protein